jgi:DNA invertase Pin-like site-specific DNA recombinase
MWLLQTAFPSRRELSIRNPEVIVQADVTNGRRPRAAVYGRVSTGQQNVESQLLPLRQFAATRGFDVVAEVTDVGISGRQASRPGLNKVMDLARKRLVDVVLVYRFDRFARSVRHLLAALQEFKALGVAFTSYSESLDTSTPLGEAIFAIVGAMAQLERDLIRERVQTGLARARAEGRKLGRPKVDVSPARAAEVYAACRSIRVAAKTLRISAATVQRLLRSRSASETGLVTNRPPSIAVADSVLEGPGRTVRVGV